MLRASCSVSLEQGQSVIGWGGLLGWTDPLSDLQTFSFHRAGDQHPQLYCHLKEPF